MFHTAVSYVRNVYLFHWFGTSTKSHSIGPNAWQKQLELAGAHATLVQNSEEHRESRVSVDEGVLNRFGSFRNIDLGSARFGVDNSFTRDMRYN